jgi:hypothetical protein
MRIGFTSDRRHKPGRVLLTCLILVVWLATCLLSASPYLHQLLHKDSQNGTHDCAVTLIGKGTFIAHLPSDVTPLVAVSFNFVLSNTSTIHISGDVQLPASCGPPVHPVFGIALG